MKPTKTIKHRVFVCNKRRFPQNQEGCCHDCGSLEVYHSFQAQVKELNLQGEIEVRTSGCLDRCDAGVVVLICQTQREKLSWLPKKVRIKLRKILFPNRYLYGNLNVNDVPALVRSHYIDRRVLKEYLI